MDADRAAGTVVTTPADLAAWIAGAAAVVATFMIVRHIIRSSVFRAWRARRAERAQIRSQLLAPAEDPVFTYGLSDWTDSHPWPSPRPLVPAGENLAGRQTVADLVGAVADAAVARLGTALNESNDGEESRLQFAMAEEAGRKDALGVPDTGDGPAQLVHRQAEAIAALAPKGAPETAIESRIAAAMRETAAGIDLPESSDERSRDDRNVVLQYSLADLEEAADESRTNPDVRGRLTEFVNDLRRASERKLAGVVLTVDNPTTWRSTLARLLADPSLELNQSEAPRLIAVIDADVNRRADPYRIAAERIFKGMTIRARPFKTAALQTNWYFGDIADAARLIDRGGLEEVQVELVELATGDVRRLDRVLGAELRAAVITLKAA